MVHPDAVATEGFSAIAALIVALDNACNHFGIVRDFFFFGISVYVLNYQSYILLQ